jgi:hypothetical protein
MPVSIGDVINAAKLVLDLIKQLADAPQKFESMSKEVRAVQVVLEELRDGLNDPDSYLSKLKPAQRTRLDTLVEICNDPLVQLENLVETYQSLASKKRKTGDRIGFAFKDLDPIKTTLNYRLRDFYGFIGIAKPVQSESSAGVNLDDDDDEDRGDEAQSEDAPVIPAMLAIPDVGSKGSSPMETREPQADKRSPITVYEAYALQKICPRPELPKSWVTFHTRKMDVSSERIHEFLRERNIKSGLSSRSLSNDARDAIVSVVKERNIQESGNFKWSLHRVTVKLEPAGNMGLRWLAVRPRDAEIIRIILKGRPSG